MHTESEGEAPRQFSTKPKVAEHGEKELIAVITQEQTNNRIIGLPFWIIQVPLGGLF